MQNNENLDVNDVIVINLNDGTVDGVTVSREGFTCYIKDGNKYEEADVTMDKDEVIEVWRMMNLEDDEAVETDVDSVEE